MSKVLRRDVVPDGFTDVASSFKRKLLGVDKGRFLALLRMYFRRRLETKPSWGKLQVETQFEKAATDALLHLLNEAENPKSEPIAKGFS